MSAMFAGWLVDTFLYTSGLIALVLLVRKPVLRHFGPQVAYALWALPLLRFALPPLVLPAWMAPVGEPALGSMPLAAGSEPLMIVGVGIAALSAPPAAGGFALADLVVPLWLGGAALFLAWRAQSYRAMRRELLAEARPVGEAGEVRLVETPMVASPLAFGVRDKVVALPPCFMALADREARDLAIAHELAHHRGHDLLANILAQPLLALHWFNPLAWAGWRAMRRDQEAACDARVVEGRGRADRAFYASVIAGFASGDRRLALAAPMACPVLGEKSIIHRLKSLSSSEVPLARRRSGLALIGAAALGLPLTATISYAQVTPPAPPGPPAPPPIERIDPDYRGDQAKDGARVEWTRYRIVRREGDETIRLESQGQPPSEAQVVRLMEEASREAALEHEAEAKERAIERIERRIERREMSELDAERREAVEQAMALAARSGEEARARAEVAVAMRDLPLVSTRASCGFHEPVIERRLADGSRAIVICNDAITGLATRGMHVARRAIERDAAMGAEARERALRQLDEQIEQIEQIERMEARRISYSVGREGKVAFALAAASEALAFSFASLSTSVQRLAVDGEDCDQSKIA